ncbi:hypothetical protein [Brevifollis gellanilyticus]|uniref:Ig-like domain-containing protein n=1 Tax=Brevifollis gellanilyticus TaxID=748831 RepID=A0A512MHT7_9BACT|nr:hypothetical protein [Brevifollis gellanilyticus]GEP46294.1 hypothetical protein BGE01nite_55850 [Brevifollis gellanilyticus]
MIKFPILLRLRLALVLLAGLVSSARAAEQWLSATPNPVDYQSVASSGDWLAGGAALAVILPPTPEHTSRSSGRVYLWQRDAAGTWQYRQSLARLVPSNMESNWFGVQVAMSGNRLLVSEGLNRQKIHAFALVAGTWVYDGELVVPGNIAAYESYFSFAASGDLAYVGRPASLEGAGCVEVFRRLPAGWTYEARVVGESNRGLSGYFGAHLAPYGDKLFTSDHNGGIGDAPVKVALIGKSGATWKVLRKISASFPDSAHYPIIPRVSGDRLYLSVRNNWREYSITRDFEPGDAVMDAALHAVRGDTAVTRPPGDILSATIYRRTLNSHWALSQVLGMGPSGFQSFSGSFLTGRELIIMGGRPQGRGATEIKSISYPTAPLQFDYSGPVRSMGFEAGALRLRAGDQMIGAEVRPLVSISAFQLDPVPGTVDVVATGDTEGFTLSSTHLSLQPDEKGIIDISFKPSTLGEKRLLLSLGRQGVAMVQYDIRVNVVPAPPALTFIQQPKGGLYEASQIPPLTADVRGPLPWTYRWFKNNKVIPGQTGATFQPQEGGRYQMEAFDGSTRLLSEPAEVGVYRMPAEIILRKGISGRVPVAVSGPGVRVQWQLGGQTLVDGPDYGGTRTPTLTLKKAFAGIFDVLITMPDSSDLLTATATLQVYTVIPPIIHSDIESDPRRWLGLESEFYCTVENEGPHRTGPEFRIRGLPPGLQADSNGRVTGIPTAIGLYTIQVSATVDGFSATKNFPLIIGKQGRDPGHYWGWLPASSDLPEAGVVQLDVQLSGAYSGILLIGSSRHSIAGTLVDRDTPPSAVRPFPVKLGGRSLVFWIQSFDADRQLFLRTRQVGSQDTDASPLSTLNLVRMQGSTNGREFAGMRTFGLINPSPKPGTEWLGSGFGSLRISTEGRASYVGQFADGTGFTGASVLGDEVDGTLYLYPRSSAGTLLRGQVRLNEYVEYLTWQRPASPGRLVPQGIPPREVAFKSSPYAVPASGPLLPVQSFSFLVNSQDGVGHPETRFQLTRQHTAVFGLGSSNPLQARMSIYAPTGFFSGQFTLRDPDPGNPARTITRVVHYRGMLLQNYLEAASYFLMPGLPDPAATPPTTITTSRIMSGSVTFEEVQAP